MGKCMRIFLAIFLWVFSFYGANAITFDVSSAGGLAGTISIDTAAGTVTSVDLTFPGMSEVTVLQSQSETMAIASLTALGPNSAVFSVNFVFLPDGLVGYSGGTISYFLTESGIAASSGVGSLSPEVSATPLPAALPLYATGLGALALLRWRKKRKAALAA
jgi:hypothetical protein